MGNLSNALRLGLSLGQSCVEFSSIASRKSKCLWLNAFGRRKNRHLYFSRFLQFFRYLDFVPAFKLSINDKWSYPTLGCKIEVDVGIIDVHVGIIGVDVGIVNVHVVKAPFRVLQNVREKRSVEIHSNA